MLSYMLLVTKMSRDNQKSRDMHFPLLFQVISRSCFRLTPAAPTIVHSVLHGCPDWPVISIYTRRCSL